MARPATAAVRLLTGEREPVRLATTANITLYGLQTIDGVLTQVGDRVVVKDQLDGAENGIRTASEGQWFRAADARTARTMQKGTTVHVQEGSANAGKTFVFNTDSPVVGDTAISIIFYMSDSLVGDATAQAVAAAASAAAALSSQGAAATSAGAASTSAGAAATSASAASTSASNAATYASGAATSATNAGNSATAAAGSATTASTAATNAGNSATAAAGSAAAAAASASTINLPSPVADTVLLRNPGNTAYITQTKTQLKSWLATSTADISFLQSGTGAIATTAEAKLRGLVSITDFGGIGDGLLASASTNATALTNALATGKHVWIPYTTAGYHFGTNQITVGTSKAIFGENQVLLKSTATTSLFYVTSFEVTAAPAVIQNFKIDMTGSGASSTAIRFATSLGVVAGAQLNQLLFTNCVEAIGDETSASNYVVDVWAKDIRCLITRGRQVYIRRSRGFLFFDTLRVDQTVGSGQTVTPVTWNSAQFEDFIGLEINRFDSVGPVTTTYQSAVYGLYINGTVGGQSSVWLNRILVDNTSGNGIGLLNINYLNGNWIESFQNLGNQIIIDTVTKTQLSNVFANGAVGVTGAAAGANGVSIANSTQIAVANLYSNSNTGAALGVTGTSAGVSISNLQAVSNTGVALVLANSADYVLVNGGYIASNGGTVSNGSSGTHNVIQNVAGYNPVGAAAVTTSASPYTYTASTSPETLYFSASTGISAITQGGVSILPAALAANVPFAAQLGPNEPIVITYTGTLTAKKMVH